MHGRIAARVRKSWQEWPSSYTTGQFSSAAWVMRPRPVQRHRCWNASSIPTRPRSRRLRSPWCGPARRPGSRIPNARSLPIRQNLADHSEPLPQPLTDIEMFYELAVTNWGPEEIEAIQRVIASDRFTMGPNVAAFEEAFAASHGRKY